MKSTACCLSVSVGPCVQTTDDMPKPDFLHCGLFRCFPRALRHQTIPASA